VTGAHRPRRAVLDLGPSTHYVTDTGPLLCLGGSKVLRDIFKARCHGKAHWVQAVRDELAHKARGYGAVAKAAEIYGGRSATWLTATIVFAPADQSELQPIWQRLQDLEKEKATRQGRAPREDPGANLGEAQSILHARRQGHTLLAHDGDARRVAREHSVPNATIVDLAQQLVAEGNKARPLANELLGLQASGIDTGRHITGPLDLRPSQLQRRPNPPRP
jgi:hypothetical protein